MGYFLFFGPRLYFVVVFDRVDMVKRMILREAALYRRKIVVVTNQGDIFTPAETPTFFTAPLIYEPLCKKNTHYWVFFEEVYLHFRKFICKLLPLITALLPSASAGEFWNYPDDGGDYGDHE